MIKLFSPRTFNDFIENKKPEPFLRNGDMVLSPESCYITANVDGTWTLTLTHPFDLYRKYTYIQKECVIGVPGKIAREQQSDEQFYRIDNIEIENNKIVATGYPVANESILEVPFNQIDFAGYTPEQYVNKLSERYPNKYKIVLDDELKTSEELNIFLQNTNLQEVINGNQDASLVNLLGCEVVYDNYTYRLVPLMGSVDVGERPVVYGHNVSGLDVTESTESMITRIFPTSYEGYTGAVDENNDKYRDDSYHVDSSDIDTHPIAYAKSIKYSDIKLTDLQSDDDKSVGYPETDTQRVTREAMAVIESKARELSEKYLRKAHNGEWDYKMTTAKRWWYGTKDEDGKAKLYPKSQYLYSWRDKSWYWFDAQGWYVAGNEIDPEVLEYLNKFNWRRDNIGWYYGDGEGHYITNGWVEDEDGAHYWFDENGYLDSQYDNLEPWNWYSDKDSGEYKNPHEPNTPYDELQDRVHLPYGYLFYSYADAISVLVQKCMKDYITDTTEYGYFSDAIKNGFKWCETTTIAGWDWRVKTYYDTDEYKFLDNYAWRENEIGYYYGDGAGHYITNGWVEDANDRHEWVNAEGYWDPNYTDYDPWVWTEDTSGWWYGSKNPDGTPKNWAKNQFIYDYKYKTWYQFDADGYLIPAEGKMWWYGTEDGSDYIFFKYHKVGDHIYWFDSAGYIEPQLAYADKYELRTDDNGDYYGDGKGHYLTNCWVEIDSSKHIWVGEDGYREELMDDTAEWKWHGSWEKGWWYGSDEETEEIDTEETVLQSIWNKVKKEDTTATPQSLANSIVNILEDTEYDWESSTYCTQINTICSNYDNYETGNTFSAAVRAVCKSSPYTFASTEEDTLQKVYNVITNSASYGRDTTASKVLDALGDEEYTSGSYCGRIKTICENVDNYTKNGLVNAINAVLEESPYDFDDDSDSDDDDDTSGNDPSSAKNYVKGQYLYISENNSWYWFDANGYATAVWMTDASWEWDKDNAGWWYGDGKNNYPQGQWMKIDGKFYFFDVHGYADDTTDDFDASKTGDDNVAVTYDSNLDGIGSTSSETTNEETEEEAYERALAREGVQAWIQDGFVEEMTACIKEQHLVLLKEMRRQLKAAAEADLEANKEAVISLSVDFETLYKTQNYEQFEFLRDYYLGDYVQVESETHGLSAVTRITEVTYDCILEKVSKLTIGQHYYIFIRNVSGFYVPGTIVRYVPDDGLEDGYGNYLTTGYNTKLSVK